MMTSQTSVSALRINSEICFTDAKGRHKKSLEKRAMKLLSSAEPLLKRVLEPDEEIQYVTLACTPFSILEFLTTGWWITLVKRCLLVVTDRRLLHLPAKTNSKPKGSISQVVFGDAEELALKGLFGTELKIRYADGKKESFTGMPMIAGKKLQTLLPQRAGQGHRTLAQGRCYLCPRCFRELNPDQVRCSGCNLGFKHKALAIKYSLLFPGGGYFYTEHPVLGALDAIAELILILMFVLGLVMGLQGDSEAWMIAGVFGVMLLFEKLITIYHATHYVAERLPADKTFDAMA